MSDPQPLDLDAIKDYAHGYRRLMRGGLGATIHGAGAFADRDIQPSLTIDELEALVAEVERLRSQREYLLSVADAQGPDGYVMSHVLRSVLGAS